MLARCRNLNDPAYGRRGIRVCERWLSFDLFLADMGTKPIGYSIERIDHDGDYEPENCRWATPKDQARNRRTSRVISVQGSYMTMAQAAEEYGLNYATMVYRIDRLGWSPDEAVLRPLLRRNRAA